MYGERLSSFSYEARRAVIEIQEPLPCARCRFVATQTSQQHSVRIQRVRTHTRPHIGSSREAGQRIRRHSGSLVQPSYPERLACRCRASDAFVEQLRSACREQRERQEVEAVVLEHGAQRTGIPGVHVSEVPRGDLESRNVTLALVPEKRGLQAAETMPLVVAMPEPPRMMKHVHVRHIRKRRRQS